MKEDKGLLLKRKYSPGSGESRVSSYPSHGSGSRKFKSGFAAGIVGAVVAV